MIRHKALVQCARVAFGLGEIVDPDEAQWITTAKVESQFKAHQSHTPSTSDYSRRPVGVAELRAMLSKKQSAGKTN